MDHNLHNYWTSIHFFHELLERSNQTIANIKKAFRYYSPLRQSPTNSHILKPNKNLIFTPSGLLICEIAISSKLSGNIFLSAPETSPMPCTKNKIKTVQLKPKSIHTSQIPNGN